MKGLRDNSYLFAGSGPVDSRPFVPFFLTWSDFSPTQENESLKSAQRKAATGKGALEVRLDRALEDVEKHKMLLNRARADLKVERLGFRNA